MGRAKPSTLREGVKLGSGIPYFKFEMGKKYRLLFPGVGGERDVFAYHETTHNYRPGKNKFQKLRCINENYQVNEDSKAAVVKNGEDGTFAVDANGNELNNGKCPLCDLEYLYRKHVYAEVAKYKEENPNATDDDIKKLYKKLFDAEPVSSAVIRDDNGRKPSTTQVFLALVYKLDDKGQYILDSEGAPEFSLALFDLSESRYNNILSVVGANKEYMSDTLKDITDEDGLLWSEFNFDYPKAETKAASGKGLTITAVPAGHSAIEKYNGLLDKISTSLSDVEKIEKTFEELPSLRVNTAPYLQSLLQAKVDMYTPEMTEEEAEELQEKTISEADNKELLADIEDEGTEPKDASSGADAFLG